MASSLTVSERRDGRVVSINCGVAQEDSGRTVILRLGTEEGEFAVADIERLLRQTDSIFSSSEART